MSADEDAPVGRGAPEGTLGALRADTSVVGEAGLARAGAVSIATGVGYTGSTSHTSSVTEVTA